MSGTNPDPKRTDDATLWGPWALALGAGLLGAVALAREIVELRRRP